ncbi:DNA polymerase IV [Psychrosphaera sp. B3R10]|uniref:DNA polymerase IV n=1 Tax=unclassified Psychrosphaera TaxID=2641570 RepID=UPI001C097F50|nr:MULTISPECIES: DNA polymerase IV [unclassified Psychrosphaera]MBU2882537.1 DNA polymerase IV [Psychrosphaera sp. I2R16]MBU2989445.1 DNA polymerase IV [Psychrosphaera sp. B3R10]MDO6718279.1 DNA polymerase IV [Psychrosphaera sp. 1_MG-2023]
MSINRKIIHVDMDAFYVSVEIRDNPALVGLPVAVGGNSDRRGVIATCNYEARKFGVRSAMATAMALKKCPNLVIVPGRMAEYKEVSRQIREIFEYYTPLIEPLSLDEAYLDVSDCTEFQGSATLIAQQIRRDIFYKTGLTASAGIAPVKFLAKVASDENKPNGQFVITPDQVVEFVKTMPLEKISGVGKVTLKKLHDAGLFVGEDVRNSKEVFLSQLLGSYGAVLWARCQGIDNRGVETERVRKSVGVERTFSEDIKDLSVLKQIMHEKLIPELKKRAQSYLDKRHIGKLGVKLKFNDFVVTTKEQKHNQFDVATFESLLVEALSRGEGRAVRLLGVHIGLEDSVVDAIEQLSLFG